jgi:hypothetical protein
LAGQLLGDTRTPPSGPAAQGALGAPRAAPRHRITIGTRW